MQIRHRFSILFLIAGVAGAPAAFAQWVQASGARSITVEGYANVTTAASADLDAGDSRRDDPRADLALRVLGQIKLDDGPDLGLRLVAESSPENRLKLAEASLLLFGDDGRLEIGERQGLPDVLTGYAPNNFSFTGAEYGPASGPSFDPGGGLQHAFLPAVLAAQLDDLGGLGASASLAGDRSAKVVYVSPKSHGYLAGFSFAPNADDARFGALTQAGLVHEKYWDSSILRLGGSLSTARRSKRGGDAVGDLHSLNLGATLILDYDLMLGVSGTWNDASSARGITTSVNYNRGRWTMGGYLQWSTSEGDVAFAGSDRLAAAEVGMSYRISTKFRIYAAWYRLDFVDEGGAGALERVAGSQFFFGARAAL
jgi:hypothetical protein